MSNVISSAIFCARNVDKVESGDRSRALLAASQVGNVIHTVQQYDNAVGRTAKTAVDAFNVASKNEKLFQYVGKGVKFLSSNVNPIVCVTSGLDVLTSKDKETALIKNTAAVGTMFAVEGLMKKHMDNVVKIKGVDKIAAKVFKYAETHKFAKGLPSIIHGTAFVIGSCAAYNMGSKFGSLLANGAKAEE